MPVVDHSRAFRLHSSLSSSKLCSIAACELTALAVDLSTLGAFERRNDGQCREHQGVARGGLGPSECFCNTGRDVHL